MSGMKAHLITALIALGVVYLANNVSFVRGFRGRGSIEPVLGLEPLGHVLLGHERDPALDHVA